MKDYVKKKEFDEECKQNHRYAPNPNPNPNHYTGESTNFEEQHSAPKKLVNHNASISNELPDDEIESFGYYGGLGERNRGGPKLIYRTSKDLFREVVGPYSYYRTMKMREVPEDHEIGKGGLWDRIRDRVCLFRCMIASIV